ncbi:MAG: hypothetical protein QOE54_4464, partial [Streptosporangiaceae bacterium]|nr:hypothetical protein [Streptosporangiaceae bacterium]
PVVETAPEPVTPAGGVGTVYAAPAKAERAESVAWAMTVAFAWGGFVALGGVAVGYAMGRRARR